MIRDITTVTRDVERNVAQKPQIDVQIEVEHPDDEAARETADELAQAVREVLE